MPLAQLQFDVDAVGDFLGAAQGVVQAGKRGIHLLGAAQIELVALHPHAVGVGAELARVDAQQDVLGLGVLAVDVMNVAGGHQRDAQPLGDLRRPLHRHPLRLQVVVLDLDVVVVAEEFSIPGGDFGGLFQVGLAAGQQRAVQLAGNAAAQADQPFLVGGQQLLVDPRLEIKPLQEGRRGEFHEVAKAGAVAGQERQMDSWPLSSRRPFFVEAAAGGDVGLQPEDRIDAQFLGRLVELQAPCRLPWSVSARAVIRRAFARSSSPRIVPAPSKRL